MNQRGRLKRVIGALAAEIAAGERPKLFVDERKQLPGGGAYRAVVTGTAPPLRKGLYGCSIFLYKRSIPLHGHPPRLPVVPIPLCLGAQRGAGIGYRGGRGGHDAIVPRSRPEKTKATSEDAAFVEYCILRDDDACETTLNPGAQVGTLGNHRASRCKADMHSRRRRAPGVVLKGQGECLHMPSSTAENAGTV